jgi:hypothetical protein
MVPKKESPKKKKALTPKGIKKHNFYENHPKSAIQTRLNNRDLSSNSMEKFFN